MTRALDQLAAAMAGRPDAATDWMAVLEIANHSLVTPQLAAALEPQAGALPAQVWTFLDEVRRRNAERNRRLKSQLADALAALNGAGIEPVLLKGAALWATGEGAAEDRLLSDLDLLVAPAEVEPALAALGAAGFPILNRYPGAEVHVVAELGRPQDVGFIDLHQRAPGPPGLVDTPAIAARRARTAIAGGWARVPDAASQMLHLVLHDQFHDGDYWRGGFDLRHLADLAQLAPRLAAEDWAWLRAALGSRLARAALDAELLAAERLAGGGVLPEPAKGRARRTYARWRLQQAHPRLRLPLAAAAAALAWPDIVAQRRADRRGRRAVLGEPQGRPAFDPGARLKRWRKILAVEMGKA